MSQYKSGILAGVVIFLLALFLLIVSLQYAYVSALGIGPGFFPTWLSGILMVLSIWYIFESVKGKNVSKEEWPAGSSLKEILFTIMSLFLFTILFALCGFIIAGAIFLFILFFKGFKWFINIPMAVGITLFVFWLFNSALNLHLPASGILF
jgi:cell division protein FtsW (lipid II flippase)